MQCADNATSESDNPRYAFHQAVKAYYENQIQLALERAHAMPTDVESDDLTAEQLTKKREKLVENKTKRIAYLTHGSEKYGKNAYFVFGLMSSFPCFNALLILLKSHYPFLTRFDSQSLVASAYHLLAAGKRALRLKSAGLPNFKRRRQAPLNFEVGNNSEILNSTRCKLSRIGEVRLEVSGLLLTDKAKISTVQIQGRKILLSLIVERVPQPKYDLPRYSMAELKSLVLGIDMGINQSVTLSNGTHFNLPIEDLKQQAVKIAKLQQAYSRKQQGSTRSRLLRSQIKRAFSHLSEWRVQAYRKIVKDIVKLSPIVAIEDLAIANMVKQVKLTDVKVNGEIKRIRKGKMKRSGLIRAIRLQAWGQFFALLEWELRKAGACYYGSIHNIPRKPAMRAGMLKKTIGINSNSIA